MPDKGFTLPEILIAMTVFLLVVGGIISANLFGLRMFQITETKLNVTKWSRETVGKITDEIHACNTVSVGNVDDERRFRGAAGWGDAAGQRPSNLSDHEHQQLHHLFCQSGRPDLPANGSRRGNTVILADSVTNTLAFSAQDFSGNVLTNSQNNQVIHLTLEFYQPARFMQGADYYKLETSVKQRVVQ